MRPRYEKRRLAGIPVEIISPRSDLSIEFISWDLSPGGTYLMTDATPNVGDHIICSFVLDEGQPEYCFFGEVSRVSRGRRDSDTGPRGFAINFLDPTPMERLKIRADLNGQPTAAPQMRPEM